MAAKKKTVTKEFGEVPKTIDDHPFYGLNLDEEQKVFVNAIDDEEEQFIPQPIKSDKLRFGFIMSSTHLHDMEMLIGMTNKLSPEIRNKINRKS